MSLNHLSTISERQQIAWEHCLTAIPCEADLRDVLEGTVADVQAAVFDRFDLTKEDVQLSPAVGQRGMLLRFTHEGMKRPDGIWVVNDGDQREHRYLPRVDGFFEAPNWIPLMSDIGFDPRMESYRNGFKPCPTYFIQRLPNPDKTDLAVWNMDDSPRQYISA